MPHALSFVVAARNESPSVLHATIEGILGTSAGHRREVFVVDDASDAPISLELPDVFVIRNETAVGVARSRRQGAAVASGDVLVWLDAHMSFAPDWLERMLPFVDTGALLCAAWWDYELTHPLCWGADFLWCGQRDHKAGRTPGFTFRHRTRWPGDGAVEVPMVIGACYMLLRSSYEQMGGFSPFFRTWGRSEQDISTRARISGLSIRCVTNARVGHLSRSRFPYPVRWEEIEFNQAIAVRMAFERPEAIERFLQPLSPEVEGWLRRVDLRRWRAWFQSRRRMGDAEFLRRYVPTAPASLWADR